MNPHSPENPGPLPENDAVDWAVVRAHFDAAMEQPAATRQAWIASHVSSPVERAALQRLALAGVRRGALDTPSAERAARIGNEGEFEAASLIGRRVGAFTLRRLLGQGGMACVFLGERSQADFEQVVAVKLLRRGLYSDFEQRLFRQERKALASLSHPNIAHLIDGGVTEAGIPFLVIEYVDGLPITEFASVERLDVRARLALFVVVCRAVAAAHHRLIVHRDIKPSNILVDTSGQPKLLDFGIAKLLDDPGDEPTRTGSAALTPGYAAPEQQAGGAITTATDVYSLGILLYELLLGVRPAAGDDVMSRPSGRVANLPSAADAVPMPRPLLRNALRGDLDNILMKALAPEPEQRYASAGALAEDIERHLAAQPVSAHPPSNWYRTRKFMERHRGGVMLAAVFTLGLIASLGVALWQGWLARIEAQRANAQTLVASRQAQRAESVRDFMVRIFRAAEPAGPRLAPPNVTEVVRVAVSDAKRSTVLEADVRIELLETLGTVLREQGDLEASLALLADNRANALRDLGVHDPVSVLAGIGLAEAMAAAGDGKEARSTYDALLQEAPPDLPADTRARLLTSSTALAIDRFERERAFAESAAAIALCRTACGERMRIEAVLSRGNVLFGFQDDAGAITELEHALAMQRHFHGGPHVAIAATEQLLSRAHRRLGHLDQAEHLARDALSIVEASVPDPHSRRSDALDTVWQVLIDENKLDEAEAFGRRVIAMDEATLGPTHPAVATSHSTLGYTYLKRDKFVEASNEYRAALAIAEKVPDNVRRSAVYRSQLGVSLGRSGRLDSGLALIGQSLAAFEGMPETDWGEVCSALEKRGELLRLGGHLQEARGAYKRATALYREKLPNAPPEWQVVSLVGLGRTLTQLGDPEHAEQALRKAIEQVPLREDQMSTLRIEARTALSIVLRQRNQPGAADDVLALALHESALDPAALAPSLNHFLAFADALRSPASVGK